MSVSRTLDRDPAAHFRSDIQGLRAIAVLAVLGYHASVPFLPGGYVGVDIFFVISGFLITSHLVASIGKDGGVRFSAFYAKRARRILPASFVVLFLSIIAAAAIYPPLLMNEVRKGALATALYVPNVLFAAEGTNYLAESTPSLFQHYWSLGVEEQFYLVWPLLLALGFRWVKRIRGLLVIIAVLTVISLAICVLLTFRQQAWAFFLLPSRAWELGAGGVTAFVLRYRPDLVRGVAAVALGWAGLAGLIASILLYGNSTPFPGYWALVPVIATVALILSGNSRAARSPFRVLSMAPMLFIGEISYSLYLLHWPVLQLTQAAVGFENPLPLWATVGLALVCIPLAWMSWKYVEETGRKTGWLARARPRRSLLAAGIASGAVIVLTVGVSTVSSARPLDAGEAADPTNITSPPLFTNYVPSNLTPGLRDATRDQPTIYTDGCHLDFGASEPKNCIFGDVEAPRVVLFGDSHAAQWFPAVVDYADSLGYAVESHTKSSCPSVSADVLRSGVSYPQCTTWRNAVIEQINHEKPVLVILSNYVSEVLATGGDESSAEWRDAVGRTIDRIDAQVVVIADTPDLGFTPSVCLSANLASAQECGKPRDIAFASDRYLADERAAVDHGALYLNITNDICSETRCDPIIGNTLVYRDSHHLTATFVAELSNRFTERLTEFAIASGG